MKNLHYGYCLIGVAAAVILLVAVGVKASTLGFLGVVLLCPLMMLVMMKTMMGDHSGSSSRSDDHPVDHGPNR
jgi:hypothetical protein